MNGETLAAHIAAFRASGAWKADPVRFRFLESMADRMQAQPEPVRSVLEGRLRVALDDFAQIVVANVHAQPAQAERHPARVEPRPARVEPHPAREPVEALPSPLAGLTSHLRSLRRQDTESPDELSSARRFRRAWESGRTLDRLEQALARSPANAGPLNSHALVVRSLAMMGDASVDYLRRFLSYAETLQWLEAAKGQLPKGKNAKAAKARMPASAKRRRA